MSNLTIITEWLLLAFLWPVGIIAIRRAALQYVKDYWNWQQANERLKELR